MLFVYGRPPFVSERRIAIGMVHTSVFIISDVVKLLTAKLDGVTEFPFGLSSDGEVGVGLRCPEPFVAVILTCIIGNMVGAVNICGRNGCNIAAECGGCE